MNTTARVDPGKYLLVADTAANELYTFDLATMRMTGQIDNIKVAAHMGTVAIPDGRILIMDDLNVEFLALRISATGQPQVVGRARIPAAVTSNRAAWGAVDPGMRCFAFSSDADGSAQQTVTLISLADYSVSQDVVNLNANRNGVYEELHV